jgi:hypothetical protein
MALSPSSYFGASIKNLLKQPQPAQYGSIFVSKSITMRFALLLILLIAADWCAAQTNYHLPAGTIHPLGRPLPINGGGNRDILFYEDFAGGIPATWGNDETGGVARWQYRGLNSTPNLEVGTQGSCLPAGVIGEPIQSPTHGNGFVIFDSNWWDNPDLPCTPENFGSGPAPGPHYAVLTSPPIDLTNQFAVGLEFYQYFKGYDVHASLELTNDGGSNWFEVYSNDAAPNPTLVNDLVQIPIGIYVGGLADIQFRFVFSGTYYFWQLDDIAVVTIPEFDMSITNATYGDFDLADPAHPTGFEFMEYSRYPIQMAPMLKFSATALNNGIYENPDVRLNVEVTDQSNNAVHTAQSNEGLYVYPANPQELRAGSFQMPATLGEYHVHQFITGMNSELNLDNQRDTTYFQIHEVQYARDRLFATSVYYPSEDFNDVPYEIGNVFLNTADNMTLYSLSVGIGVGTTTPTTVYGALYEIDFTNELLTTLIATTQAIPVSAQMLNGYADQIMTTLTFDSPITLENGKAYLAMAGSEDGGNFMVCALAGDAHEYTSWVHFYPEEWRLVNKMPMVRMNFGDFDSVEENVAAITLKLFPNPATENIFIPTERSFDQSLYRVIDSTGRILISQRMTYPMSQIEVSSLSAGMYVFQSPLGCRTFVVE